MKRLLPLFVILAVLFSSCAAKPTKNKEGTSTIPSVSTGSPTTEATPTQTQTAKVSDYFPLTKDVYMKYKGAGNEYAGFETYVDYITDNLIQIRQLNGGTIAANVYKVDADTLKLVASRAEIYYRYDFTSSPNRDEILIQGPIKTGTAWTLKDGSNRSITAVDKQVETPSGTYKALEVTTKGKDYTTRDYYAKDIGKVKTVYGSGESTIESSLEKVEKDIPYEHTVMFYYPDFKKEKLVYIEKDIEIRTNEDMKWKFQKEMKTVPANSGLSKVLTTGVQVLKCGIDEKKGIATIDFSKQLVTEMNAGTTLESMILNSITNTIGHYYQVTKVIILVEGKPYESGHVLMKPGEFFTVGQENSIPYKK